MNNKEINELIFCLGKVTLEIYEYKKMKEKYDEYVLNWDRLTYKVSEESFFK